MALRYGDTKAKKETRERKAYERVCANSFAHAREAMYEAATTKSDALPDMIKRYMVCRLRMPWHRATLGE
jgi:hypothetical protein